MKMRKLNAFAISLTALLSAGVFAARAADFWWVNESATGNFSVSGNWEDAVEDPGVPGAADWALFERGVASATTVVIDGSEARDLLGLRIGVDKVILDLNGNDLRVGLDEGLNNFMLRIGYDAEGNQVAGDLTLKGGGELKTQGALFGTGMTTVTGSGTWLNVLTGNTGTSPVVEPRLRVEKGGRVSFSAWDRYFGKWDVIVDDARLDITGAVMVTLSRSAGDGNILIRNGGLMDARDATLTTRQSNQTLIVNDAVAYVGKLAPGHWTATQTVKIEDGGVMRAGSLQLIERNDNNRSPRVHVTVEGHAPEAPASVSRLLVVGDANIGQEKTSGAYRLEEGYLTVRSGGQLKAGGQLGLFFSDRVTIDGGTVIATSMNVSAGKSEVVNEETIYSNAEYVFTLNQAMVGAAAPLRILEEVAIPEINAQDELGDDVIYAGSGNAVLGAGHMELTLAMGLDEFENPFAPQIGQTFNLLQYEGDLTGYFLGLQPNSTVDFERDGVDYRLDYGSGTNDAITLTVIPEPHTLGLLLAAGALLALRRRRGVGER